VRRRVPFPRHMSRAMHESQEGRKELSMVVPAARDGLDHKFCFV